MTATIPDMVRFLTAALSLLVLAGPGYAADLRVPEKVTAGTAFSIASEGSGKATFYLVGPSQAKKREVQLGGGIQVHADEVERAGHYTAIVCSGSCESASFYVQAAEPSRLSLLVHPSRVRVSQPNSISAVAVAFDKFHNLALKPAKVEFKVAPQGGAVVTQSRPTENGIAWVRLTSAQREGPTKIGAALDSANEFRVVRQVASDACNLRIKPDWSGGKLFVQTDPVRDCSGNNVPDGTVVSFTKIDASGKTTVDAPIKHGIARVELPISGDARISVASGVVTGNELALSGKR